MICRVCGGDKKEAEFTLRKDSGRRRSECNPCRANSAAAARYGITVGEIEALKVRQKNRCAICGVRAEDIPHASFKHNPLVIDHSHTTGKVRGLLCPTCNVGIGQFKESAQILTRAIAYLTKHSTLINK